MVMVIMTVGDRHGDHDDHSDQDFQKLKRSKAKTKIVKVWSDEAVQ